MASKNLELYLIGRDVSASRALRGVQHEAERTSGVMSKLGSAMKAGLLVGAGAAVYAGAASVRMAADFQTATTQLVTGAGEAKKNLDLVSKGLLEMSTQVGASAVDLAHGLYNIESAGFHGARGLHVLKVASEGAKVGAADMATVADAVTTALNAYSMPASKAADVTNTLIDTVKHGKTHLQDLASSLGQILPYAAALRVKFSDVSGAMATLTNQGVNAAKAATSLRFLMVSLVHPASGAATALGNVGLSTEQVGKSLVTSGLGPTLQMITDAVGKKFPEGSAAYVDALASIVGGTRGLTAAFDLTGKHLATYQNNVKDITTQVDQAKGHITGWAQVQDTFNQKLDVAKAQVEDLGIKLGTALIPYVSSAVTWFSSFVDGLGSTSDHLHGAKKAGQEVGQIWKQDLVPALDGAKSAIKEIGGDLLPVVKGLGDLLGRNKDLTKFAAEFALAALAAGKIAGMAGKFGGLFGKGGVTGVAGKAGGVIPVYVTNWGGTGTGPGGVPIPGGGGAPGESPGRWERFKGSSAAKFGVLAADIYMIPQAIGALHKAFDLGRWNSLGDMLTQLYNKIEGTVGGKMGLASSVGGGMFKQYGLAVPKAGGQTLRQFLAESVGSGNIAAIEKAISLEHELINTVQDAPKKIGPAITLQNKQMSSAFSDFAGSAHHSLSSYVGDVNGLPAATRDAMVRLLDAVDQGKVGARKGAHELAQMMLQQLPPNLLAPAGSALVAGLIASINAKTAAFANSMTGLAAAGKQAFVRANQIASPSKLYKKLMTDNIEGLLVAIDKGKPRVVAAVEGLSKAAFGQVLTDAQNYKQQIVAQVQAAAQNLASLRSSRRGEATGIASTIIGQADLSNMQGPIGIGNTIGFLTKQRNADRTFRHDLNTLENRAKKLHGARRKAFEAMITQLAAEGAAAGGAEAHVLAVQASDAQIVHVASLEAQIRRDAGAVGSERAQVDYRDRIDKANHHLQDVKGELKDVKREIRELKDAFHVTLQLDGKTVADSGNRHNARRKNRGGQAAA